MSLPIRIELSNHFLEEEVRCGYFVSSETKKIWAVELDLLSELDKICKRYNINYYADGGTMLGAIRHNGFIPWDDDIDIVMLRKDYQKFLTVAMKELEPPYFLQTEETDPGSLRGHAQMRNTETTAILETEYKFKYKYNQGIFIDIFPLDYLPDESKERKSFIRKKNEELVKVKRYSTRVNRFNPENGLCKQIITVLFHIYHFGIRNKPNKKFKEFEQSLMNNEQTGYLGKLFFYPIQDKRIWRTEWFSDIMNVDFEMLKIPVSTKYEEIMSTFWGDWKTPVIQNTTHGKILFDTDKPYTEYILRGWGQKSPDVV